MTRPETPITDYATDLVLAHHKSIHICRDQWFQICDSTIADLLAEKIAVCGRIDAEVERIRKSRAAMREWSDDYTKPPPLQVIADDDGVARIAETWAHRNADDKAEAA